MLLNLHVKNLALIEETEIEFGKGMNILTGETGAGKSVLLGSVNLALGGKAGSDVIGRYGDSALVELAFSVDSQDKINLLQEMDIYPEGGVITISRRILPGKSVIKVNSETMTAAGVRKITELLIDIHGQHDHQSLLYKKNHLEILDKYAKDELSMVKARLSDEFSNFQTLKKEFSEKDISIEERNREKDFLLYEINEIENANLKPGEDEELECLYRKIINSKKIMEELNLVNSLMAGGLEHNASDMVGRAYQAINQVAQYDEGLSSLLSQLSLIDNQISDFNYELKNYISEMDFDDRVYIETENRLNLINGLKAKYGNTIEDILAYYDKSVKKLEYYNDYEEQLFLLKEELVKSEAAVNMLCQEISSIRKKASKVLQEEIKQALLDLNFEQVAFEIQVTSELSVTKNGYDEVEFMISVNPGEGVKPLARIASGGEMSRIMLGIKSVLAGKDDIDTLIFDEIDTGISGRTAQKVSEKMVTISRNHQIICITHLPQIAAMADTHFLIHKEIVEGFTKTDIEPLNENAMIEELARMLGGSEITDIVRQNARQMKEMGQKAK